MSRPVKGTLQNQQFCAPCYNRITTTASGCPECGRFRILAYRGVDGVFLCAECAGQPVRFACKTCGGEEHLVGRNCARCVLTDRMTALITAPSGEAHPQLKPVRDAVLARKNPRSALRWVARASATSILKSMADGRTQISHEGIDSFARSASREYLRDLLIASGALAAEPRELRDTLEWIDGFLTDYAGPDRHVLTAYSRWNVIRRVRARAARGKFTSSAAKNVPPHLRVLGDFMMWLAERRTDLATARQAHVDEFLTTHPEGARHLPQFLKWAHSSGRCGPLTSPTYRSQQPTPQVPANEHWDTVERLLHDNSIRIDTRICGLFVLLYGQRPSHICQLTRDLVVVNETNVLVRFAADPIVLPPGVDDLFREHLSTLEDEPTPWLFPGRNPDRPIVEAGLSLRLRDLGISPQASRTTAMMQLAAQLPAAVLAGFLGIHPQTAVAWSKIAASDWSTYPALRLTTIH
ncbi:hypothetical protein [Microbacterium sp. H1-D42]|uniref:hypothetical protein n=1 Tax=Microbacterium sp. H1-D42 TaxID=2925844 RepID=UPI001F52F551|nr:hypothetical protein [Microbacterium sp. H1-D42]UNK69902.1 hypothetical protein MNR00_12090 [Microbacterium sp. H1-D42]